MHKNGFLGFFLVVALLIVYLPTSAGGLSWSHGGADSGELAMAAALGGVAHPPGYGLYTMVGGLFTHLLGLNPARGMVGLSILSAVFACLLIAAAVWTLLRRTQVERVLAAIMACAVLGFSRAFWSQAVIIEVYAFMALLFCVLVALAAWDKPPLWAYALMGHVFGLALTHHLTALIWLPGLIVLVRRWTPRKALFAALGVISGLYPYLILLLRAGQVPAADWGGIETGLPAFFEHITGALYRQFLQPITVDALLGGIGAWLARLPSDLTIGGLILVVFGVIAAGFDRRWRLLAASLIWCVGIAAFTGLYTAEDTQIPYTLPLSVVMAVYGGFGISAVIRLAQRYEVRQQQAEDKKASRYVRSADFVAPLRGRVQQGARFVATLVLMLIVQSMVRGNWDAVDVSRDDAAQTFVATTEALFPDSAVLITGSSAATFTLWYAQHVEGTGAGWVIIDRNLWRFDWYREDLVRVYPSLPESSVGVALEAWLRDPAFDAMPIASDVGMMPPPGRTSERVGEWTVIR